jgi:glycine cleavage system H protein
LPDRLYSETHEWVTIEDGTATVGITDYAQAQLGDVVFLELPQVGAQLEAGDSFGVIESVKAASDLYSPVAGEVVEINDALTSSPELVNREPYGGGWLMRLQVTGETPGGLLDEAGYRRITEGASSEDQS